METKETRLKVSKIYNLIKFLIFFVIDRSNSNLNSRNIVHLNYPNTDSPFCVQNREIINMPTRHEATPSNETNVGWRPEVVPNAPSQLDVDQAPPPYSSVVINDT